MKTYDEFLDEGWENVNKIMDKILMVFCLTGPALCIGKVTGLFSSITYVHIVLTFIIAVIVSLIHHTIIKKNPKSKKTCRLILISIEILLIIMANAHIGIYITLFLVPMISIIYNNISFYFIACAVNYVCTVIIAWTTSAYYSGRDLKYMGDALSWFFNRMGGYTLETIIMVLLGYCVVKTINVNVKKLYLLMVDNKIDKLTGIFNRKAFDEDKEYYVSEKLPEDLIIFYIDINCLKTVNDNKGHIAGDELIWGTSVCLTEILGKYGNIYRLGGDEFISIIHSQIAAEQLFNDIKNRVFNWKGELVDSLRLSVGYACVSDNPDDSFINLQKKAEQMMYSDKEKFYAESGIERRRE